MADMKPVEALQLVQSVLIDCEFTWGKHLRLQQAVHVLKELIEPTTPQAKPPPTPEPDSPS